jgi:hypothetical protein
LKVSFTLYVHFRHVKVFSSDNFARQNLTEHLCQFCLRYSALVLKCSHCLTYSRSWMKYTLRRVKQRPFKANEDWLYLITGWSYSAMPGNFHICLTFTQKWFQFFLTTRPVGHLCSTWLIQNVISPINWCRSCGPHGIYKPKCYQFLHHSPPWVCSSVLIQSSVLKYPFWQGWARRAPLKSFPRIFLPHNQPR